jgi:hypothetical protein
MPESPIERILREAENLLPEEREALVAALTWTASEQKLPRRSALGKYAGLVTPVDEFLGLKREETLRENEGVYGPA